MEAGVTVVNVNNMPRNSRNTNSPIIGHVVAHSPDTAVGNVVKSELFISLPWTH